MQKADELLKLNEAALIRIVQDPAATVFQKNVACRRLAVAGTAKCVPALAAMLGDAKLAHYARFALGPNPDASVDAALRAQLGKLKGRLLVGVIDTIGQRRDAAATEPVAKLMHDRDVEVACAAAAAVGAIGGSAAARHLWDAVAKTKDPVRTAAAEAGLVCAERLLAAADRPG